jgi:uncharacterized phage protein (TIGR01671 family)
MRETKYIGWSRREKKWLPVKVLTQEYSDWQNTFTPTMLTAELTNGEFVMFDINFNGMPVRQYTGLKDKNGTESYAKDIIDFIGSDGFGGRYIVDWNDDEAKFSVYRAYDNGLTMFTVQEILATGEVIGNIYENPELLK